VSLKIFIKIRPSVSLSARRREAATTLEISYVSGEESEKIVNGVLSISPKIKENLQFLSQAK